MKIIGILLLCFGISCIIEAMIPMISVSIDETIIHSIVDFFTRTTVYKEKIEIKTRDDMNQTFTDLSNTALKECGAKIISSSKDIQGESNILSSNPDKYLYSFCKNPLSFIIELCEQTQIVQFQYINKEMFSSNINEFELQCSLNMINFTTIYSGKGKNSHSLQIFDISPIWCKYLSFTMISSYGKEQYCTLTQIKVIGLTLLNELIEDNIDPSQSFFQSEERKQETTSHRTTFLSYSSYIQTNPKNLTILFNEIQDQIDQLSTTSVFMSVNYITLRGKQLLLETSMIENYIFTLQNDFLQWNEQIWNGIITNKMKTTQMTTTLTKYQETIKPIHSTIIRIIKKTQEIDQSIESLQNEFQLFHKEIISWKESSSYKLFFLTFIYLLILLFIFISISIWICIYSHKFM